MKRYWLLSGICLIALQSPLAAEDEIAFEDEEEVIEECHGRHCERNEFAPHYNPEEEHFYRERNTTMWPGKRDDSPPLVEFAY